MRAAAKKAVLYPNKRTQDFFEAVISGDMETIKHMARSHDDLLQITDSADNTALDVANTYETAWLLLKLGMPATALAADSARGRGLNDVAALIERSMPGRARG